jgi:integrase
VNLADGKIKVPGTKTDTAVRTVRVLPVLRDELDRYPAPVDATPDALVFATSTGRRQGQTNVRRRILAPAVELANERLIKEGLEPLPRLTPHSLRRTFASLLFAIDTPLPRAMQMMGHRTASLTLEVYATPMDDDDGVARLKALVNGEEWPAAAAVDGHPSVTRAELDVEAARP